MEHVSSIDIWKKRLASTKGFTKSKAGTEVPVQSEGRARHEVNNLVDWNCFDELIFLGAKTFTHRVWNSSEICGTLPGLSGFLIGSFASLTCPSNIHLDSVEGRLNLHTNSTVLSFPSLACWSWRGCPKSSAFCVARHIEVEHVKKNVN